MPDEMRLTSDSHREEASYLVHGFAMAHGVMAFFLANTLFGDTLVLTGLTIGMIVWLGNIYDLEIENASDLLRSILGYTAGPLGLYAANKLLFWLPGIGNWSNAVTTIGITEAIGWSCIFLFSSGRSSTEGMSDDEIESLVSAAQSAASESKKETELIMKSATDSEKEMIRGLAIKIADASTNDEERKQCVQKLSQTYASIKARVATP